jgi:hypothetical protein
LRVAALASHARCDEELRVGRVVVCAVSAQQFDDVGFAGGGREPVGASSVRAGEVRAVSFSPLALLPTDFSYPQFAGVLLLMGLSMGAFASPNRAGVMNSLPPQHRGAGGGMNQTFQNSAQVLSIGVFFTLMIVGLSSSLPHALASGLTANGVLAATAAHVSSLPPISVLFAAFLGYNPAKELIGPHVLRHLPPHDAATISGRGFFPHLIAGPFRSGLHEAFFIRDRCLSHRRDRFVVAWRNRRLARNACTGRGSRPLIRELPCGVGVGRGALMHRPRRVGAIAHVVTAAAGLDLRGHSRHIDERPGRPARQRGRSGHRNAAHQEGQRQHASHVAGLTPSRPRLQVSPRATAADRQAQAWAELAASRPSAVRALLSALAHHERSVASVSSLSSSEAKSSRNVC